MCAQLASRLPEPMSSVLCQEGIVHPGGASEDVWIKWGSRHFLSLCPPVWSWGIRAMSEDALGWSRLDAPSSTAQQPLLEPLPRLTSHITGCVCCVALPAVGKVGQGVGALGGLGRTVLQGQRSGRKGFLVAAHSLPPPRSTWSPGPGNSPFQDPVVGEHGAWSWGCIMVGLVPKSQ